MNSILHSPFPSDNINFIYIAKLLDLPSHGLLATTNSLLVSMPLTSLGSAYQVDQAIFSVLCLPYVTLHNVLVRTLLWRDINYVYPLLVRSQ